MNEIVQDKWYELPQLLPMKLSGTELSALLETVNSDGWAVFKKVRDFQARSSACIALNPSSPSDERQAHRALWFAMASDLEFGARLKELAAEAEGVDADEIMVEDADSTEAPIPSAEEFKKFNEVDKQ